MLSKAVRTSSRVPLRLWGGERAKRASLDENENTSHHFNLPTHFTSHLLCFARRSGLRDMSKLVFNELNKRSHNPIYNLLPDIIGQLSTSTQVKKEQFRTVVSFLLNFIIKEKQNEMLVEKLCHRFEACKTISQKVSERSERALMKTRILAMNPAKWLPT